MQKHNSAVVSVEEAGGSTLMEEAGAMDNYSISMVVQVVQVEALIRFIKTKLWLIIAAIKTMT